jgi:hypothetical protein
MLNQTSTPFVYVRTLVITGTGGVGGDGPTGDGPVPGEPGVGPDGVGVGVGSDGFARERRMPGQAFVEGGGGGVHVSGRAGLPADDLLRRHVPQGARGDRAVADPGRQAEVGQLARALAVDQDVLGLVVAVHHAALVRGGQAE